MSDKTQVLADIEIARLNAALTESRREVEALKADQHENCYGPEPIRKLEAENATLRQEVERLKNAEEQALAWHKTAMSRADEAEREATALRRQVEEQAAKLAEASTRGHAGCNTRILELVNRAEQAESSLAAMTRERDEANAVLALKYEPGTLSEIRRLAVELSRLNAALSQAQEHIKALREAFVECHNGNHSGCASALSTPPESEARQSGGV